MSCPECAEPIAGEAPRCTWCGAFLAREGTEEDRGVTRDALLVAKICVVGTVLSLLWAFF